MYKVDETILYGSHGVCRIVEISERKFNDSIREYYVLRPIFDEKATLFVPIDNENLVAKMRQVLSKEEIQDLIQAIPDGELIWIENEPARKEKYKAILSEGDRMELIQLIKTLHIHQTKQQEKGKKLHISDERFLKDAEKLLHAEFAHVLKMNIEEVSSFIMDKLKKL
ncbi:CarD family transcriptional regulator [Lachnospiraceae bacterium OttesenSCG-928-E19]|nr:CarD family transcriptional regulator [Lachnospiraceae bacterium OttesenSCG-928-E19]